MEILCKGGKNPCYSDSVERWERFNPHKKITALDSPSSVRYMHHHPHQKTLTRLGNTSHETTAPYKAGLLLWKGYEMKKYIPIDFDEKGKVVLGNAKNTPTSNGFIPTTWAPGGSDEEKQGLKSITISPAITTTPALDSLFPIYYEDLTDEQKQDAVFLSVNTSEVGEKSVSITPTGDWYASYINDNDEFIVGGKGETIVAPVTLIRGTTTTLAMSFANGSTTETATAFFSANLDIRVG